MFGKTTDQDRKKLKDQLENIHTLFKNFISKERPKVDIENVATGEYWFGSDAIKLKLVDEIITSDEYILLKKNDYDLIIAGRESIDYNGCMVPGLIGELTNIDFVTNCVKLEIDNSSATASREIEGGIEKVSCELPLIIGSQKGLVEESDLKIPNMRGIMQARQKPLEVIEPESFSSKTTTLKYSKPEEKGKIRMINPENLDELVEILHTEEKII